MIKDDRKIFTKSLSNLRRARRLYHYLIRDFVKYGNNDVIFYFVKSMQSGGLYAESTSLRSIRFSLARQSFQNTRVRRGDGLEWYSWKSDNNFDDDFNKICN